MLGPTRTFAGSDFTDTKRGIGKLVVLPTSDANVLPASKPRATTGVEMIMRRIIRPRVFQIRGKRDSALLNGCYIIWFVLNRTQKPSGPDELLDQRDRGYCIAVRRRINHRILDCLCAYDLDVFKCSYRRDLAPSAIIGEGPLSSSPHHLFWSIQMAPLELSSRFGIRDVTERKKSSKTSLVYQKDLGLRSSQPYRRGNRRNPPAAADADPTLAPENPVYFSYQALRFFQPMVVA